MVKRLCKVNFPLYCCQTLGNKALLVAGGGGAAKTGVRNAIEILELHKIKKSCIATSIDQLDTESHAVMSMSVCDGNEDTWKLAISKGNKCCIYEINKKLKELQPSEGTNDGGLVQRKKQKTKTPKNIVDQSISSYKFRLLYEVDVLPGENSFQTCVKISSDGSLVVSGANDGFIRIWKLDEKMKKLFEFQAHKDEVSEIDISPDSKQIISTSHDGHAIVWDATTSLRIVDLHSTWSLQMMNHKYRFRNCRFGFVSETPKRLLLFTSHTPVKLDPKEKTNCCITKWAKKRDGEGKEIGGFLPAIVKNTGSEAISTIALSRNGVFVGVGFMEGSVALYISFSLQCALRCKSVHSIFVTSLTFLNDCEETMAFIGSCDAAIASVSADSTCHLTKLASRGNFTFAFVIVMLLLILIGVATYIYYMGLV